METPHLDKEEEHGAGRGDERSEGTRDLDRQSGLMESMDGSNQSAADLLRARLMVRGQPQLLAPSFLFKFDPVKTAYVALRHQSQLTVDDFSPV